MSTKSRTRRERRPQAPLPVLLNCVQVVADHFGTEPRCHEAAVILQSVGKLLGYDLLPRAVALFANDTQAGRFVTFGTIARDRMPRDWAIVDRSPDPTARTGHVVLVCAAPMLLIDATLRQLANSGIAAQPLVKRINSLAPESGVWAAKLPDGLDVVYMPDPVDTASLIEAWRVPQPLSIFARDVVRLVRGGLTGDDIRARFVVQDVA